MILFFVALLLLCSCGSNKALVKKEYTLLDPQTEVLWDQVEGLERELSGIDSLFTNEKIFRSNLSKLDTMISVSRHLWWRLDDKYPQYFGEIREVGLDSLEILYRKEWIILGDNQAEKMVLGEALFRRIEFINEWAARKNMTVYIENFMKNTR